MVVSDLFSLFEKEGGIIEMNARSKKGGCSSLVSNCAHGMLADYIEKKKSSRYIEKIRIL